MVRGRRGENGFGPAEADVDLLKPPQESRHRRGADRNMTTNRNVARSQLAGNNRQALLCCRVLDPQHGFRQQFVEATVNLEDGGDTDCASGDAAFVLSSHNLL